MRYLYITGLMRSGTTIVANFLNTQKDITIYRDFLVPLRNQAMRKSYNTNLEKKELIHALKKEAENININLGLNPSKVKNVTEIYKLCLHAIISPHDRIVGNKCTQSLSVLKKLITDGDIYGLYVIRDIRDVILSTKARYIKLSRFKEEDMTKQCYRWKKEVKEAMKLKRKYPDSFHIIKYEEFVQKKANKPLEQFLGHQLDWNIKTFKERHGDKFIHNSSFKNLNKASGLSTYGVGRWKTEKKDIKYITEAESICRKELVRLGYIQ